MANIVQLLLSIVLMGVGQSAMKNGMVGAILFAAGGIVFINTVRSFWLGRNASSIAAFAATLASVPDLDRPKQIIIATANPLMRDWLEVFLNGEAIGKVKANSPLVFSVVKQRNVVSLPGGGKSACFFETSDPDREGRLEIRMGLTTPIVAMLEDTGLRAFTPDKKKPS